VCVYWTVFLVKDELMFGTKSEKIAREVEQLELKLEELETSEAARPPGGSADHQYNSPKIKAPSTA
jgi:Transposase C of IS166 homeodomain